MATANFMNVSSVKGVQAQVNMSKKLQEENVNVAEAFAGLMNQSLNLTNMAADEKKSTIDVSKINSASSAADSYERYCYKDRQIHTAKEQTVTEKLEENSEVLEQTEEEAVAAICEAYGVDEETVKNLLDEMGLSALDLLNPKNLVSFLVALTGMTGEELLLDENFLKIMETFDQLEENLDQNLMKDLGVDLEGLQTLVAEMDAVEEEAELPAEFQEVLEQAEVKEVQDITETEETVMTDTEDSKISVETMGQTSDHGAFMNQDSDMNQSVVLNQSTGNAVPVNEVPQMQFSSYFSADSVHIMEQIVQQMRVNLTADVTSMEMQLNPENLGKVYVNISSEEGVINAQFRVTNEIVKEAMEAQIVTLRENLNQAGVKVDAIEVTIASHEFERNLEQNQRNAEEQAAAEEKSSAKRRNITMDSLDELSGIMTEEETLVAQIMKDNGNSVDLTA